MQIIKIEHEKFPSWRSQIEKLFNSSVRINFPDADVGEAYGKEKCDELDGFLQDGTAVVFVAIDGRQLAGWVWCHKIHRLDGNRIHIAEIAVDENWHRRGIGSRLLEKVEQYAAENGYQAIDLLVTASNMSAVKFYENASFEIERSLMKKVIRQNVHT